MSYRYQFQGDYMTCPSCGAPRKFRQYYDATTGQPLGDEVGKCFKASCALYTFDLREWLRTHPRPSRPTTAAMREAAPPKPVAFIQPRVLYAYRRQDIMTANLCQWLSAMFKADIIRAAAQLYFLGCTRNGAVIWPQIDEKGRIRDIKYQNHDAGNGHRTAQYFGAGAMRKAGTLPKDSRTVQCLFGQHLLRNVANGQRVGIVESEKTAYMMAMRQPQVVWLATGGCGNTQLIQRAAQLLKRCNVVLYPDAGIYKDWHDFVQKHYLPYTVSRICEGHSSNTDVADLLVSEHLASPPITPTATAMGEVPTITPTIITAADHEELATSSPPSSPSTVSHTVYAALSYVAHLRKTKPAVAILMDKLELVEPYDPTEPF